jgi:2,3-bisphosphoglycerate-dependent phosphoglycerate mutase
MSAAPTDFLFIRHGETAWNREHRFQGQANPPLNASGLAQAARLGSRLAATTGSRLVSSDLLRAMQTAEPLARAWGQAALSRPGLREQAFGDLEGLTVAQVQQEQAALWAQWLAQDADFALPGGGESQRQFQARVLQQVADLAREHPGGHLTVVTHGGVLDMLWRAAHGLPLTGLRECEIPNTGLNHLRYKGGRLTVLSWADAAHLADMPPLSPYSSAALGSVPAQ